MFEQRSPRERARSKAPTGLRLRLEASSSSSSSSFDQRLERVGRRRRRHLRWRRHLRPLGALRASRARGHRSASAATRSATAHALQRSRIAPSAPGTSRSRPRPPPSAVEPRRASERAPRSAPSPRARTPTRCRPTAVHDRAAIVQYAMSVGTRAQITRRRVAVGGEAADAWTPPTKPPTTRWRRPTTRWRRPTRCAAARRAAAAPPQPPPGAARERASAPAPPEELPVVDEELFLHLDESKLPLELFDSLEYERRTARPRTGSRRAAARRCPSSARAPGSGARARSWNAATERFSVAVEGTGVEKEVRRLNIRFDDEDGARWERRRATAMERRELVKQHIRLQHYVSKQPNEEVRPIQQSTLRGVHEKVADGLPADVPFPEAGTSGGVLLRTLTSDVIHAFTRTIKRAIVFHKLAKDARPRARCTRACGCRRCRRRLHRPAVRQGRARAAPVRRAARPDRAGPLVERPRGAPNLQLALHHVGGVARALAFRRDREQRRDWGRRRGRRGRRAQRRDLDVQEGAWRRRAKREARRRGRRGAALAAAAAAAVRDEGIRGRAAIRVRALPRVAPARVAASARRTARRQHAGRVRFLRVQTGRVLRGAAVPVGEALRAAHDEPAARCGLRDRRRLARVHRPVHGARTGRRG